MCGKKWFNGNIVLLNICMFTVNLDKIKGVLKSYKMMQYMISPGECKKTKR